MLVEKNGKQIEVTEKAYKLVYEPKGFKPVGIAPFKVVSTSTVANINADLVDGYHATTTGEAIAVPGRLTAEELEVVMKNKGNVTQKLQALGVEYDNDAKSDDLKALLESELAARDLLPE